VANGLVVTFTDLYFAKTARTTALNESLSCLLEFSDVPRVTSYAAWQVGGSDCFCIKAQAREELGRGNAVLRTALRPPEGPS